VAINNQPPVIDIAEAERVHVHRAIDVACREWGVFQVVGHGIDLRLIAALRRQMRALFAAPGDQKLAIARSAKNPWGFYDRELTRYVRDWKQVYDYGPADGGDIAAAVEISLEEAFHGTSRIIELEGRRLEVTIPRGANTGSRIRLTGKGPGGRDLIVVTKLKPHRTFTRKADDLEHYAGNRGRRGLALPRGWRTVDRLTAETKS